MKKQEKKLFKNLCSFKSDEFDNSLLEEASPTVLGQLFFNRMQSVAYDTLRKHNLLSKVNREFRNSLKAAYDQNIVKNDSFFKCVQYLNVLLSKCNCRYAMLKGAYLCRYYPDAYRTSNDIDLLVSPKDVTKIGNILLEAGFEQGYICNDKFVPATRREIIESKMMRGETVPYIKEFNLPGMRFLEVDINFSLDYKPGDAFLLEDMLGRSYSRNVNGLSVTTLNPEDFFIHLCNHLHKETTTLPWVEMKRDMTLYKYCDIYMLISEMNSMEIESLFSRAKAIDMEKICAFAIAQTASIFDFKNKYAVLKAKDVLKNEPDFLHTVFSPQDKKVYVYTEKNIEKRFFAENRKLLLTEVKK